MSNVRTLFKELAIRFVVALPFFVWGIFSYQGSTGVFDVLTSCVFICAGALVLAFPLARLLAEPAGRLYWGGEKFDKPQPIYSIPEAHRAQGRYDQAIKGLEDIALEHPEVARPHVMMMDIAVRNLKDPARARSFYSRGLLILKSPKSKALLEKKYRDLATLMMRLE